MRSPLLLLAFALLAGLSRPAAGAPSGDPSRDSNGQALLEDDEKKPEEKKADEDPGEKKPDEEKDAEEKEAVIAIVGGTVYPVSGPPIRRGTVIIKGAKIEAVGSELPVPDGAQVVDANGRHVTPGFVAIEASRVGVAGRGADMAASLDPYDFDLRMALAHGITTANVSGGASFSFFRGRVTRGSSSSSIVIKLTYGELGEMLLRETGLNSLSLPSRQIELNLFNLRDGFRRATEHLKAVEEAKAKKAKPPRPSSQIARYVTILENKQPTLVAAGTPAQIRDILAIRDEYPFDLIVSGPVEGASVARELATRRVPVVLEARGADFDFDLMTPEIDEEGLIPIRLPATFVSAGCDVAIRTRSSSVSLMGLAGRDLTALAMEAAFAVRGGLSEEDALAGITLRPAQLLGLADRVGSLEKGKDADLLILNRNPLDYRAFVLTAYINGKVYYDRSESRLFSDVPLR